MAAVSHTCTHPNRTILLSLQIPSTEGRVVGTSWADLKPEGSKGQEKLRAKIFGSGLEMQKTQQNTDTGKLKNIQATLIHKPRSATKGFAKSGT
jgi:hypothetical protein